MVRRLRGIRVLPSPRHLGRELRARLVAGADLGIAGKPLALHQRTLCMPLPRASLLPAVAPRMVRHPQRTGMDMAHLRHGTSGGSHAAASREDAGCRRARLVRMFPSPLRPGIPDKLHLELRRQCIAAPRLLFPTEAAGAYARAERTPRLHGRRMERKLLHTDCDRHTYLRDPPAVPSDARAVDLGTRIRHRHARALPRPRKFPQAATGGLRRRNTHLRRGADSADAPLPGGIPMPEAVEPPQPRESGGGEFPCLLLHHNRHHGIPARHSPQILVGGKDDPLPDIGAGDPDGQDGASLAPRRHGSHTPALPGGDSRDADKSTQ